MDKYFILLSIVLLTIVFTSASTVRAENKFSYFPEINSPDHLITINEDSMNSDEFLLLSSLQGILAQEKPEIYITGNQSYDNWLSKMKNDYDVSTEKKSDVFEILELFQDQVPGYILTEKGEGLNVATSLAGIKKAVLVTPKLEEQVQELGLEQVMDARDYDLEWVFEEYKDEFNNSLIFTQDPSKIELRDYMIATRSFVLFAEDDDFYEQVYNWVEDDAPRLGWGPAEHENVHVSRAGKEGLFTIPADWAKNISALAGIDVGVVENGQQTVTSEEMSIFSQEEDEYLYQNEGSKKENGARIVSGENNFWTYEIEVPESDGAYIEISGQGNLALEISGNEAFYLPAFKGEVDGSIKVPFHKSIRENFDDFYLKFSANDDSAVEIERVDVKYINKEEKLWSETEAEDTPDKVHYVSFVMSDGDNVQWLLGGKAHDENFYGSKYRGMFPMNWGIAPSLIDLAPAAMEWYYEQAIQDYFVAGPSGGGYMYPSENPDLEKHAERLNEYFGRSDLSYSIVMDWPDIGDEDFREVASVYAAQPNIEGILYYNYAPYDKGDGKIVWENGKPFIAARENLWDGNPERMARTINSYSDNPEEPEAYTIVNVHAWSHNVEDVAEVVNNLDSHVKVVNIDEFFKQVKKNLQN